MIKRADSLRSQIKVSIATDLPTKQKLHAAANARGITLSELLRMVANSLISDGQQQQMSIQSNIPVNSSAMAIERVHQMEANFEALLKAIDSKLSLNFGVSPEEQHRRLEANIQAIKNNVGEAVQLPGMAVE